MAVVKIFKTTSVPATYGPNEIYFVSSGVNKVEVYVSNSAGTGLRRVLNESDVQTMINTSLSSLTEISVVADIAARNALNPTTSRYVFVRNATGDATVASGAAAYIWDVTNTAWVKVSEFESMDVSFSWAGLTGKPTSSPAAIDAAVGQAHSHGNLTQLNLIGQDGNGDLTYNGNNPRARVETVDW